MATKKKTPKTKTTTTTPSTPTPTTTTPADISAPAIEAIPFTLETLGPKGVETHAADAKTLEFGVPTFFAAVLGQSKKRFRFLLQRESTTSWIVVYAMGDNATRLPPAGGWQRALVTGTACVLASDTPISREQMAKALGGHEPPPAQSRPPYT
jgi:hypothetical protein